MSRNPKECTSSTLKGRPWTTKGSFRILAPTRKAMRLNRFILLGKTRKTVLLNPLDCNSPRNKESSILQDKIQMILSSGQTFSQTHFMKLQKTPFQAHWQKRTQPACFSRLHLKLPTRRKPWEMGLIQTDPVIEEKARSESWRINFLGWKR